MSKASSHTSESKKQRIWRVFKQTLAALTCTTIFYITLHYTVDRLNPAFNKIADLKLSDLSFAYGQKPVGTDENIYLVNCVEDDREEIASKIHLLDSINAKVIGVDITFLEAYKGPGTDSLVNTLQRCKDKTILVKNFNDYHVPNPIDERIYNVFFNYGYIAFDENLFSTRRHFEPYYVRTKYHDTMLSFSFFIFKKYTGYSADSLQEFMTRHQIVNYKRAYNESQRYTVLNTNDDIYNVDVYGKIALLGSWDTATLLDKHYTPLNKNLGRSWPDMNGVEYHAQVLSMLIDRDFVYPVSNAIKYTLVFALTFLLFWWLDSLHKTRLANVEHLLAEIAVSILTALLVIVSVLLLDLQHLLFEPIDVALPIFISMLFHNVINIFTPQKTSH